jgi:hypothetical protein
LAVVSFADVPLAAEATAKLQQFAVRGFESCFEVLDFFTVASALLGELGGKGALTAGNGYPLRPADACQLTDRCHAT